MHILHFLFLDTLQTQYVMEARESEKRAKAEQVVKDRMAREDREKRRGK